MTETQHLFDTRKKLVGLLIVMALLATPFIYAYSDAQATSTVDTDKLDQAFASELENTTELLYYDVLITFDSKESVTLLDRFDRDVKSFNHLPIARVLLSPSEIAEVTQWDTVRFIEPNRKMKTFNAEGREMTNSEAVQQELGYDGEDVEIAIIDTGADGLHPDLIDNMTHNWQVAGTLISDSGYVSTTPDGIDVDTSIIDVEEETGVPVNTDEYGHGTHVFGTIAGTGDASDGYYRGMAPQASVQSYSSSAGILLVFTVEAYDHILDQVKNDDADIRLISNSWGSEGCEFNPHNAVNVATYEAYQEGILSVFAYGNSGPDVNTCNPYTTAPYVLGIGATDKAYKVTGFSSRGIEDANHDRERALQNFEAYLAASSDEQEAWDFDANPIGLYRPSVTAPGADIVSAQNPLHPMTTTGTLYGAASGTSMATPMVTGVLGLVIDAYEENNDGSLSPLDLIRLTEVTANKEVMHGYQTHDTGAGFVDAQLAVERAVNNDIPTQVTEEDLVTFEWPAQLDVKSGSYEGTVPANTWESNEGYETHTFEVKEGALKAYADLSWENEAENLYISLYEPGADVSDTNAATAQSAALLDTSNSRFVEVTFPEPGTWTVRIDGRNNTVTSYSGNWEVSYETDAAEEINAVLYVTPERISGNETVDVQAAVTNEGGIEDINSVSLVVRAANGNELYHWTKADFDKEDVNTLAFDAQDLKMSGKAPWTVTLEAENADGNVVYEQALIGKK
ncbi:S8 family peptidase [Caldalkalibacillus salinus]|uniref:S8 family peptidase n=1 Tax=Caldalkalibacillus salinus TaxID=2803787 RepID=UPI001EFFF52E|nr:S8 family serine peptidase [Caldalkalibacillus salinus]